MPSSAASESSTSASSASRPGADLLTLSVFVSEEGDFSTYILAVTDPTIDEERSEARFSFKAGCPTEFDCRVMAECPPEDLIEPALDYLAKDYQSFRRLLVDLISERNPVWQERLPADLGIALVELIAYAGDYLSYLQDAGPGTEGYLDTCLHRVSAARHARLIDYRMHDGRNAFSYVHFISTSEVGSIVPAGARLLTRIGTPLMGGGGRTRPDDRDSTAVRQRSGAGRSHGLRDDRRRRDPSGTQ